MADGLTVVYAAKLGLYLNSDVNVTDTL